MNVQSRAKHLLVKTGFQSDRIEGIKLTSSLIPKVSLSAVYHEEIAEDSLTHKVLNATNHLDAKLNALPWIRNFLQRFRI